VSDARLRGVVTVAQARRMTTTTDLDRLALRSPDALVAALPYLLGFHPTQSAVLLWLRRGTLLLTQRLDLPPVGGITEPWRRAVWSHPGAEAADELVLVVVTEAAVDPDVVDAVLAEAKGRGIEVRDAVHLEGRRWRSLLCPDPECCPPDGRPLDDRVLAEVGAEFTALGRAPLADREAVVASMAPDPELMAQVRAVRRRSRSGGALERWRDTVLAELLQRLAVAPAVGADLAPIEPRQAARLLDGLVDVRVRDTVLWEAGRWEPEELTCAVDALLPLLRCAPPGRCAPVATCVALLCWLGGDGARAGVALARAHADDPDYSLAALVAAALHAGLPATAWREAMLGLTREECRHGT
jgi:hypothetical protein